MAYEMVWEPEGVYSGYSGFVSGREMIESAKKIHADPRFDEARYVIKDLSRVSQHDLSEAVFTDIAVANYGAHLSNPNCRIVCVTPDEDLTKIIENTLKSPDMRSYQVEVKPTLSEARDWLDSQPRLFEVSSVMGVRSY